MEWKMEVAKGGRVRDGGFPTCSRLTTGSLANRFVFSLAIALALALPPLSRFFFVPRFAFTSDLDACWQLN